MVRRFPVAYEKAITWLAVNDDNSWLDEKEPEPSVAARFLIRCYQRSQEEVIRDLRQLTERDPAR